MNKNVMKFTEKRFITWDAVRSLCIEKNWYTSGTNEEYGEMLAFVEELEEATTEALTIIATDIYKHSNTDYCIESIMWELNRICNTQFMKA